MQPEIIHAAEGIWYVLVQGVLHGPFFTRHVAEMFAADLAGKCKDCSA